jgi:hypothetical protein
VQIVLKSLSLNLLEPSGPVKGCNRIALTYFRTNPQITSDGGLLDFSTRQFEVAERAIVRVAEMSWAEEQLVGCGNVADHSYGRVSRLTSKTDKLTTKWFSVCLSRMLITSSDV